MRIFSIIGAFVVIVAIWWFFLRGKATDPTGASAGGSNTDAKKDKMNGGDTDPATGVATGCFNIPKEFPKYNQSAGVPDTAKTLLGIADADWTPELRDRLLGWFVSIDVAPAAYVFDYFGKETILSYLNSPEGHYPSSIVVKGKNRCDNQKSNKMGGY